MSTRIRMDVFKKLLETNSGLYHALLEPGVAKAEVGGEVVVIDDTAIKGQAFKTGPGSWSEWIQRNPQAVIATTTERDELWQAEQAQAKRDAQKENDAKAAARANWWIQSGLLPSDHNLQLIQCFIREKAQGLLSGDNVDLAVNQLREQLQWKPKLAEPVAAPVAPPPPILIDDPESPTGKSEQLSLDEQPRSRHSKAQLRDWDKRKREARNAAVRAANTTVALAFRNAAVVNTPALEVEVL